MYTIVRTQDFDEGNGDGVEFFGLFETMEDAHDILLDSRYYMAFSLGYIDIVKIEIEQVDFDTWYTRESYDA